MLLLDIKPLIKSNIFPKFMNSLPPNMSAQLSTMNHSMEIVGSVACRSSIDDTCLLCKLFVPFLVNCASSVKIRFYRKHKFWLNSSTKHAAIAEEGLSLCMSQKWYGWSWPYGATKVCVRISFRIIFNRFNYNRLFCNILQLLEDHHYS